MSQKPAVVVKTIMAPSNSNEPDFWTARYIAGKTPWDLGGVPAALNSFLERSSAPGRVLIPGCGSGYEVRAFHDAGYDVTAIDFSPAAVNQAKRLPGYLAERIILADFFTHDFGQRFDFIYERTFLCSMTPNRWPDYVNRMSDLLSPGGKLVGVFLYGERESSSGPPFPITEAEAEQLFTKHFQLVRTEPMTDSLPLFRGMERWQEWLNDKELKTTNAHR